MELSRERKIFLAVAAVAGAAFVIDRGVLGASQAEAAPVVSLPGVPPAVPGAVGGSPAQLGGVEETATAIARRIQALIVDKGVGAEESGDAFRIPQAWVPPPVVDTQIETDAAAPAPVHTFVLSAAMPTRRGGIAVIDNRTYRTGDTIGAYTLVSVTDRSATLEGPGGVITLEIQR